MALRVLIVTGMWPSVDEPDYGAFVRTIAGALAEQPDVEVDVAAVTTRASGRLQTPIKYAGLSAGTLRRARRADVLWGHFLVPAGAVTALAGRIARRPWVLTAHGGDVANLERSSVRRASRMALRGAAATTAVSEWLRDRMNGYGISEGPVDVVNMGVDLGRYAPRSKSTSRTELGIADDAPLVLAVGGLTPRKNPLALLEAVAQLRASGTAARLAFVGGGPLDRAVRAEASARGLSDSVTLTGPLSAPDVARWMGASDLLALVSRPEPLGVVALEALASGRPVVVTSDGGTREILASDPGVGAVVDPTRVGDIASAIGTTLNAPATPERCRAVAQVHDVAVRAGEMAEILARAAGRR